MSASSTAAAAKLEISTALNQCGASVRLNASSIEWTAVSGSCGLFPAHAGSDVVPLFPEKPNHPLEKSEHSEIRMVGELASGLPFDWRILLLPFFESALFLERTPTTPKWR